MDGLFFGLRELVGRLPCGIVALGIPQGLPFDLQMGTAFTIFLFKSRVPLLNVALKNGFVSTQICSFSASEANYQ